MEVDANANNTYPKILVIEDDVDFRMIVKRYLESVGTYDQHIYFVTDGRRGLNFSETGMPDVILLDYQLPDMTGVDFLRAHRELPNAEQAAVIILTGQGDESIAAESIRYGATDYMSKSDIDPESLTLLIRRSIERNQAKVKMLDQAQRLMRYESVLDAINDAIFIIDADSAAPYEMNAEARGFFPAGHAEDTVLGVAPFPNNKTEWWVYIEGLRGMEYQSRETELQKAGQTTPIEVRERLVWHEKNHYVVAVARDITAFREIEEQLKQTAVKDALTGLPNRRAFDEAILAEWQRAQRDHLPKGMGLLIIDIDCFKQYNDSLGHVPGDQCLKRVALIIQSSVTRKTDLACRIGGEEFAVLLHGAGELGCQLVAERILRRLARAALPHPSSSVSDQVTVSIGAACASPDASIVETDEVKAEDIQALIERADKALYRAKAAGRNGFILDKEESLGE